MSQFQGSKLQNYKKCLEILLMVLYILPKWPVGEFIAMDLVTVLWSGLHFYPLRWIEFVKYAEAKFLANFVDCNWKNPGMRFLISLLQKVWPLYCTTLLSSKNSTSPYLHKYYFSMAWKYLHNLPSSFLLSDYVLQQSQDQHTFFSSTEAPHVALCCVYPAPTSRGYFSLVF